MISSGKKDYLEKIRSADTLLCWKVRKDEIKDNIKRLIFCQSGLPDGFQRESHPGIEIISFPGINAQSVAEHAITLLLLLKKRVLQFQDENDMWETKIGIVPETIKGSTVCLLGAGHAASTAALILKQMGAIIIGTKRSAGPIAGFDRIYHSSDIYDALKKSDSVISFLPLNPTTRRCIGEKELFSIKRGGVFINVSRGEILNESALLKALDGHLSSAALDVFQMEPQSADSPMLSHPRIVTTPHMAGTYASFWEDLYKELSEIL